jgi:periplasmic copper chaperone A
VLTRTPSPPSPEYTHVPVIPPVAAARRRPVRCGHDRHAGGRDPAFAHITAQPGQAEQGDYAVISLRVPTESDTAGTVTLQVTLPAEHPITSVRTTPRPGWTVSTSTAPLNPPIQRHGRTITEAVNAVTWTADPGTRIGPGECADFPFAPGPLPDTTDRLVLPAAQTYDDGEVVARDQPPASDGSKPERPAPAVTPTPAAAADGPATEPPLVQPAAAPSVAPPVDPTARWLDGAGLLVGALGLGVGAAAVLRSRNPGRSES